MTSLSRVTLVCRVVRLLFNRRLTKNRVYKVDKWKKGELSGLHERYFSTYFYILNIIIYITNLFRKICLLLAIFGYLPSQSSLFPQNLPFTLRILLFQPNQTFCQPNLFHAKSIRLVSAFFSPN